MDQQTLPPLRSKDKLFAGWAHHLDRCAVCGLVYERNSGDTWAFTVIGDRLPVAAIIVLLFFGFGRVHHAIGYAAIVALGGLLVWTAPNRWGVGIALHDACRAASGPIRRIRFRTHPPVLAFHAI